MDLHQANTSRHPHQEPHQTPSSNKDTEKPILKLAGDKLIYLTIGDRYEEPGATATDNIDGDITDKIVTSGKVDTSKEGSYQIKYIVKDKAGNLATATRTVIVKKPKDTIKPVIKLMHSKFSL